MNYSFLPSYVDTLPAFEQFPIPFLSLSAMVQQEFPKRCPSQVATVQKATCAYNTAKRAGNAAATTTKPPLPRLTAPPAAAVVVEVGDETLPLVGEPVPATTELTTPVAAAVPMTFPAAAQGVLVNVSPDSDCE